MNVLTFHSLFNWFQCLCGENADSTKHSDEYTAVGILHMVSVFKRNKILFICLIQLKFHFADHIDFVLMFIVACMLVIYPLSIVINLILAGQLAGLFATESFNHDCHYEHSNLTDTIKNNTICPLGIDLNSFNFPHFYK
jgi:hypothetical protein